jgi:hypothetical protein
MLALDGQRAKAGGLWLLAAFAGLVTVACSASRERDARAAGSRRAAVEVNPVRTPPRPGANLRYPSAGPGR